ncbi:MAG TPA: NADPH:quinone oxidoreductase family protein [Phenylobacterium sp.]
MRRVEASVLESISDYRLVDGERPAPGPGEVLVKVGACGVGYVDALVALGRYQVKPPLPHTPGQEVGGSVEAVGDGVSGLAPGDRVMAAVRGGFAEYALAAAQAVTRIPDRMSFSQAAGFRVNYLTALHGLRDRGAVRAGETVLVFGAAGGVGSAAVQVAKLLGAQVIAAASTEEKRAFCLGLGADVVIDTAAEGWRDRLKGLLGKGGLDVVFDPVCGPLFEPAFRSLSWGGRHLVVGFVGGIPALPVNLPLMKGAALAGVDVRQFLLFEAQRAAAHLAELLGWVAEGRLSPPEGRSFEFDAFAQALEFALEGAGKGKTVLNVAGPA